MKMHITNYTDASIEIAPDCPATKTEKLQSMDVKPLNIKILGR